MIGVESNVDEIARRIGEYYRAWPGMLRAVVAFIGARAVNRITEAAPKKTGDLARSVRMEVGDGPSLAIFTAQKYAPAQEFGSGIHGERGEKYQIRPVTRRALRWAAAGSGGEGWTFRASVMHPGVPATHFFFPSISMEVESLEAEIRVGNDELMRGCGLLDVVEP